MPLPPKSWKFSTLGEVTEINPSRKELATLPDDLDVPFVPMAAISEEGQLVEARTRKAGELKRGFSHFRDNDILVAKITPCFENGKRWGKGITYWEVADEQGDMCQICMAEEIDALFYDCGHVCSCVECAKHVESWHFLDTLRHPS